MSKSTSKQYQVYCLVDPITNEVRYVGKATSGLKNRLSKHSSPSQLNVNTYKARWLRKLKSAGYKPIIMLVQEVFRSEDLYPAEQYWIGYFKSIGCDLTNLTDGGPGRLGSSPSQETRKKISDALCGNKNSLGFKHTYETRLKVSAAVRGVKRSPETIVAMSKRASLTNIGNKNTLGYKPTKETRNKLSMAGKGRKHTEEAKQKMSAKAKGRPAWNRGVAHAQSTKEKISRSMLEYFSSRENNVLTLDDLEYTISVSEKKVDI